ncbi:MAG: nucleotidyltransferase family protein [Nitrospira sp.]|nr:nucleotidyltransferase family protein [Nitrospira sp.]
MWKRVQSHQSIRTLPGAFRPEIELLLCCARTRINSKTTARIKTLLQEDLNWDYLLRIALQRSMMPLLYWNLNATYRGDVPKNTLAQLRAYFQANARHNLFLTRELLKLLKLFETHDIPAIPYKGPVLASSVYGNLSLRQFGDLDILVPQRNLLKAKDLLITQGYQPLTEWNNGLENSFQTSAYNLKFIRNDGVISLLELHWRVTPPYFSYPFELESFWERLEPISLAGTTVLGLALEDLLLILCIHGSKDNWRQLGWVCDVAELIYLRPELNWERVMVQANKLGCERMLYLGLFMASDLLGATLPKEVWSKMQADPMVKSLAQQMRERLFSEDTPSLSGIKKHVYYLRLREKWRDKLAYLLYQARSKVELNIKDRTLLPLPATLSFLYYPLRSIRLVKEYGLTVLKELQRF